MNYFRAKWQQIGIDANKEHQILVDRIITVQYEMLINCDDVYLLERSRKFKILERALKCVERKMRVNRFVFGIYIQRGTGAGDTNY